MKYQSGFGNSFQTEAETGAVPSDQNSPQKAPLGLYAEQFSTSSFTVARSAQRRSWFYRIRPSVLHSPFEPYRLTKMDTTFQTTLPDPNQMRWNPMPEPTGSVDFIDGIFTFVGNGDPRHQIGCVAHVYSFNQNMTDRVFTNADAEMILIPQQGSLELHTECGRLHLEPNEIAVIPRGLKFQVHLADGATWARGYLGENYGAVLRLPDLGPIGSNGLASARDFLAPVAYYENDDRDIELVQKYLGRLFVTQLEHSPLDVVGWHGNSYPYKYDLRKFNTIGTVSFDHPDPSIFTVLTSPSSEAGVANMDFAIFPPRWMVAEHTFRPPYYHRNVMSEFMGLITGAYDAKQEGFVPGGASLHNCMQAHGPDQDAFEKASGADLRPMKIENTMAFMFESRYPFGVSQYATDHHRQFGYYQCWQGLKNNFKKP